jgi:hypothetical protein
MGKGKFNPMEDWKLGLQNEMISYLQNFSS